MSRLEKRLPGEGTGAWAVEGMLCRETEVVRLAFRNNIGHPPLPTVEQSN